MDPVLDQLEELLAGRVTVPLDQEEWTGCITEANRRIDSEEPPGYLDADKGGSDLPEGGAGDYLVWYQTTRYAREQDRDLLIVTRDEKEDWWWRQQSELIGRPGLSVTRHAEWARVGREASGCVGMTGGACGVVVPGDRVGTTEWGRPARLKLAA